MAETRNITVNIEIHGTLNPNVIAEEVKYHLRKEIERVGVKVTPCCEEPKLKVGDYAKVIQTGHCNEGEIVEILSVSFSEYYPFDTKLINGKNGDCHRPDQLIRATNEEVSEAKWAKIGRKPNEFKVGDAVRYKKAFTTVTGVKTNCVNISQKNGYNLEVDSEKLTLVFPAETRFDA